MLHPFPDDVIDYPVFLSLVGRHDVIALGVFLDTLERLSRVVDQDLIQPLTHAQNFTSRNVNVGRLSLEPLHQRLMDHDSGIGQGKALTLGPRRQEHCGHRGRMSYAHRLHIRLDELHRVVNRQPGCYRTSRTVDIEKDILVGVFGFQEQHLSDDEVRNRVVDRRPDEDDTVLEEPRKYVIGSFAAVGLLNHHWYQLGAWLDYVAHWAASSCRVI